MHHEEELRRLYEDEHLGLARTAFFICGDSGRSEEVVSEAFARAAERWSRIRRYDRPGAWLRLVVVRLALRVREHAGREQTEAVLPDVGTLDPPPPDPQLYEALRALTTAQRDCVVLHHVEDLAVTDIAELLDLPAGTVRSHLHRARQRLAALLTEPYESSERNSR